MKKAVLLSTAAVEFISLLCLSHGMVTLGFILSVLGIVVLGKYDNSSEQYDKSRLENFKHGEQYDN